MLRRLCRYLAQQESMQDYLGALSDRLSLLGSGTFAHHHERGPVGRVGLARLAFVDHRQHGAAQRLGAAELLVARSSRADRRGDQLHGRVRVDLPVRDQQRAAPA